MAFKNTGLIVSVLQTARDRGTCNLSEAVPTPKVPSRREAGLTWSVVTDPALHRAQRIGRLSM